MNACDFRVDALLEEAAASAGLYDFGPDDFRAGLEVLAATYAATDYTPRRRARRRERLLGLLATRLRVAEGLRRHPEIREQPIARPLVVTGLPRSGTSAQLALLAADPAARPLLMWEAHHPYPLEGLAPGAPDPRREAMQRTIEQGRWGSAEMQRIHAVRVDNPEECVLLHAYALNGVQTGEEIFLEPYASWFPAQGLGAMYAYHATLLRTLAWQRMPGERWLLKAPAHMWGLDSLLAEIPDAGIVWSHRDPVACTASACSMTFAIMKHIPGLDPRELGPRVMEFYALSLDRGLAARARCDAARFCDVAFNDLCERPIEVAERVYAHFGLPFSDPVRAALLAHVEANPRGQHGVHDYVLERFGLSADRVRDRFADYLGRFEQAAA